MKAFCIHRYLSRAIVAVLVAGLGTSFTTPAKGAGLPSSRPAEASEVLNFSLLDYKGKYHELHRTDARFVVLFFTSGDCPIARQSAPKLEALRLEFESQGVVVWMVNSMPQNDPTDRTLDMMFAMRGLAPKPALGDRNAVRDLTSLMPVSALGDQQTLRRETLQYVFGVPPFPPILRDEHQLVSEYFGVARTCEALVIDTKSSIIVYRGAVDDQFTEGGSKAPARPPVPA